MDAVFVASAQLSKDGLSLNITVATYVGSLGSMGVTPCLAHAAKETIIVQILNRRQNEAPSEFMKIVQSVFTHPLACPSRRMRDPVTNPFDMLSLLSFSTQNFSKSAAFSPKGT